jgi:hypothetical protein
MTDKIGTYLGNLETLHKAIFIFLTPPFYGPTQDYDQKATARAYTLISFFPSCFFAGVSVF